MTEDEFDAMVEADIRKRTPPKAPRQQSPEPARKGDDAIAALCPGCGRALRVPARHAGRRVECKKCGTAFVASPSAPPPEPPTLRPEKTPTTARPAIVEKKNTKSIWTRELLSPKAIGAIALVVLLGMPVLVIVLCCGGVFRGPTYTPSPEVTQAPATYDAPVRPTPADEVEEWETGSAEEKEITQDSQRTVSDDAVSLEERIFHAEARALVIRHVERNKLGVGGREFRVKRNPIGPGCFVYDPRTRFRGVERNLVWLVLDEDRAYALNSPSKMVTPSLKWSRDDGVLSPTTSDIVDYVFRGKPMSAPAPTKQAKQESDGSFTVEEYRIYRDVIDTPFSVSEAENLQRAASSHGVTEAEVTMIVRKVQRTLLDNNWFGSASSEIKHASDWDRQPR